MNLLKPYYCCLSGQSNAEAQSPPEHAHQACSVGRVSVVYAPQTVAAGMEDWLPCLDPAVLQGRLKNSESLCKLHVLLSHLLESKQADLSETISIFPCLFGDTPTQMHLIKHNIDVGDAQPVRQRFYCVNPEKRKYLDAEVSYMLDLVVELVAR